MLDAKPVGWFAPTYKILADAWREIKVLLQPLTAEKQESEHRLKLITGGVLEMWSLEDPNAGRGRKYARAIVDEAAMTPNLEAAWTEAIRPTLTDLRGDGWFCSTPKGRNYFWRLYCMGQDEAERDWACWHMPTSANPYIDPDEVEAARTGMPERAFRQEYLAEFVEESGGVFRGIAESVDKGRSANEPLTGTHTYVMGVDLARVEDFTVLTVLDDTGRQVYFERFNQISWERQLASIDSAARAYGAHVLVDSTGVGDPIFERLRQSGLSVEGYQISSASKEPLIDGLAMGLEQGRLRLMDIPAQTNELMAYQYELTPSRNVRMNAPEGMHDDTVTALALAWQALPQISIGHILTGTRKRETAHGIPR